MSAYSGKQGKGARKILKERKREEAQQRQRAYDTEVLELAERRNISLREARHVLRSMQEFNHKSDLLNEIFAKKEG